MKIAFVHNLPNGGAKRACYDFINGLVRNHKVDLFYIDKSSESFLDLRKIVNNSFYFDGPTILNGLNYFVSLFKANSVYKKIAKQIDSNDYDVVFVNPCKVTIAPLVLRYLNTPTCYYCHEPLARALEKHVVKKNSILILMKKLLLRLKIYIDKSNSLHSDLICANSLYSIENIYRFFGKYPALCKIGIDTNKFINKNLDKNDDILCVGALLEEKGQDFLIKSVSKIEDVPAIKFISNSCDEVYKDTLIKLAKKLNVKVSFKLLTNDDDLINEYNKAKFVVFPSRLEPLGLVPLEAMSCGTPVVAVAEGGVRETVIHNKTGLLSSRDLYEFSSNIKLLLNDEYLRKDLSNNCSKYVKENWSLEISNNDLEKNLLKTIKIKQNNY